MLVPGLRPDGFYNNIDLNLKYMAEASLKLIANSFI